jgi:hypothetical protein
MDHVGAPATVEESREWEGGRRSSAPRDGGTNRSHEIQTRDTRRYVLSPLGLGGCGPGPSSCIFRGLLGRRAARPFRHTWEAPVFLVRFTPDRGGISYKE